jgi:ABC-2 type transport system permease protein
MATSLAERSRPWRAAAWLGLQIESNWSDPFVFSVYAFARPLATALILTVMYRVVVGGALTDDRFTALFVGNALYVYVIMLLVGLSWAIFEDREQYKTLRYVATAPSGLVPYLLGRSAVKFGLATLSATVLLVFGVLVLGLELALTPATAAAFVGALLVGAAGIVGVGLVLAGCAMVFSRLSMMMNEGVSAILYLMCGVVFPPDFLPKVLQPVALALPMTWWLEASRRALGAPHFSTILGALSDGELTLRFGVVTLAWIVGGYALFKVLERRARSLGLLDITTAW